MNFSCLVAICGTSLFMQSVEAALAGFPEIKVEVFNCRRPDLVARLGQLLPDLVILEKDYIESGLFFSLLQLGLCLVELNSKETVGQIFRSEQRPVKSVDDLLFLVGRS